MMTSSEECHSKSLLSIVHTHSTVRELRSKYCLYVIDSFFMGVVVEKCHLHLNNLDLKVMKEKLQDTLQERKETITLQLKGKAPGLSTKEEIRPPNPSPFTSRAFLIHIELSCVCTNINVSRTKLPSSVLSLNTSLDGMI